MIVVVVSGFVRKNIYIIGALLFSCPKRFLRVFACLLQIKYLDSFKHFVCLLHCLQIYVVRTDGCGTTRDSATIGLGGRTSLFW
jgi:hypothetical protein